MGGGIFYFCLVASTGIIQTVSCAALSGCAIG